MEKNGFLRDKKPIPPSRKLNYHEVIRVCQENQEEKVVMEFIIL